MAGKMSENSSLELCR